MRKFLTSFVASVVVLGFAANFAKAELIANGNFSSPVETGTNYSNYGPGDTSITGWTVDASPSGGVQLLAPSYVTPTNGYGFPPVPVAGEQGLQLFQNPGNPGGISQTITGVGTGTDLSISFYVGGRYTGNSAVELYLNGVAAPGGPYVVAGNNNLGSYTLETLSYIATGPSVTLDFQGVNIGGGANAPMIQNVSVVAVPEPASIVALGGLGAMGLLLAVRRRRRNATTTVGFNRHSSSGLSI